MAAGLRRSVHALVSRSAPQQKQLHIYTPHPSAVPCRPPTRLPCLPACPQSQGFIEDGKLRTIPLEIFVVGDKEPVYEESLEELGR